jgi:hypothetical protein
LVWIDAREAILVRWVDHGVSIERIESEVPEHHKTTGLVRRRPHYDRNLMSGGYGHPHTSAERHRLEHLARFLDLVAARLSADDPVHIIGPGPVREHLRQTVGEADARGHRTRALTCEPTRRLTERQLVARIRTLAGDLPRRGTVGAYRWTDAPGERVSGAWRRVPRRAVQKPPDERDRREEETAMKEAEAEAAEAEASPFEAGTREAGFEATTPTLESKITGEAAPR